MRTILVSLISLFHVALSQLSDNNFNWIVSVPQKWREITTLMIDPTVENDSTRLIDFLLPRIDSYADGEVVDAIEHYFWNSVTGVAMEIGALDGTPSTRSSTFELERTLGWKRILIEGDPKYRMTLKFNSPLAYSVNAAICNSDADSGYNMKVHFRNTPYVGGILEFMGTTFLQRWHQTVYDACETPGDLSTISDWSAFPDVTELDCIKMSTVLQKASITHVNFFVLDVEGGELDVLKSIDWGKVRFDVLAVETDAPNRPAGNTLSIVRYLQSRGYNKVNVQGETGRNTWFQHASFVPSARPDVPVNCYRGALAARYTWHTYQYPDAASRLKVEDIIYSLCGTMGAPVATQ